MMGGQVEGWSMEEFMLRRNPRETTTWSSVANSRVAMSVSGLPRNDWLVEFTQDAHLVFEGGATVVGLRLDDAADRDFTVPIVGDSRRRGLGCGLLAAGERDLRGGQG